MLWRNSRAVVCGCLCRVNSCASGTWSGSVLWYSYMGLIYTAVTQMVREGTRSTWHRVAVCDLSQQFRWAAVYSLPVSEDLPADRAGLCEDCCGSKVYRLGIMDLHWASFSVALWTSVSWKWRNTSWHTWICEIACISGLELAQSFWVLGPNTSLANNFNNEEFSLFLSWSSFF